MPDKIKSFFNRWVQYRQQGKVHRDLDVLLVEAKENKKLEDRLQWFVKLLHWVRYDGIMYSMLERDPDRLPLARLRYLFMVLDRNEEWKKAMADNLRIIVHEVSSLELYTETGLPKGIGLWSELADRLMMKILPIPPLDFEVGYLFWALFPSKLDRRWLAAIDRELFEKVIELYHYDSPYSQPKQDKLKSDLEDGLVYLVIQARAIGLSPAIRHRIDKTSFRESAFFALMQIQEEFKTAYQTGDLSLAFEKGVRFKDVISECRDELNQVHKHLDKNGVSVDLVFQMIRLNIYLLRMESLIEILLNEEKDHKKVMAFLSDIVKENQELRSIKSLFSQNISLLARKIAERAAETGEHYITRTKEEYREMLKSSFGGGAVMSVAVYIKLAISFLGISVFIQGVFASFNYILSFVVIQLAGFTLATKQPSMTAPALAEKMRDVEEGHGTDELVTEIVHLIRSQVASIFGNILVVFPLVILIDLAFYFLTGAHILPIEKAHSSVGSLDIFGPSVFYASFTGFLLWISSIIAGWGGNWFALNSLRRTLARSPSLQAVFGKRGAVKLAMFLDNNISGFFGNIFLGLFLGMIPVITKFIGIQLDIRHVTIAVGNLASAIPVLGLDFLKTWGFFRAVIGIFAIGFLNVFVSFALAFLIAIRARGINPPQRRAIRKAVVARFFSDPLSFFWPSIRKNKN